MSPQALARSHEAALQHERSLRVQAIHASRGLEGDKAATAEGADKLRQQLASSVRKKPPSSPHSPALFTLQRLGYSQFIKRSYVTLLHRPKRRSNCGAKSSS
jgi:hypothetical protein